MASKREMLEAGEELVEYMDICHDNPVAHTPLAVQRLMDAFKRALGVDDSSGIVCAEAPRDAAVDAPRFF